MYIYTHILLLLLLCIHVASLNMLLSTIFMLRDRNERRPTKLFAFAAGAELCFCWLCLVSATILCLMGDAEPPAFLVVSSGMFSCGEKQGGSNEMVNLR